MPRHDGMGNIKLSKVQHHQPHDKAITGFPFLQIMSLWSSYRNLSPRTRFLFGAGLMTYAAVGMWWSPKVEEALGMVPSKEEQADLDRKLSVKISTVER
ncbi:conserved hypothetical protein [Histoplasma capsulatum var. duboisii H88]|uniref:Uncharacterized protein n=3 Tax=Ajellomyces capsulatus TaxID=5037 RepID=F0URC0_AJEC8|nr:conserved hypothetical protein [Histoplasma capsulatum H143]EGC48447.1 conserved hypothetical protein [Histoplasma capsulatum var. duboisii H88]